MTAPARMSPEREAELDAALDRIASLDGGLRALVQRAQVMTSYCCQHGCGSGGCYSCPCCDAGWCVMGGDGELPERPDQLAQWVKVAAEYNPVAAALAAERQHAQQVEVPLSAAHGFALHVQTLGDSFVVLSGCAGAGLFPSVQAVVDAAPAYEEHGEVVTPVALVPVTAWAGADGRIGS